MWVWVWMCGCEGVRVYGDGCTSVNAQLRDCNSSVWHGMKEEKKRDWSSLVPRPLPDFISQPWRKIGRRPGIKTTSRTGNGGLGQYKLTESTISGP